MAAVIWTGPALADLRPIIEYVARDSPTYAERLGTRLVASTRRLRDFPLSGRLVPEFQDEAIREILCGSYRIIYVVREEACFVTAVIHASRSFLVHVRPEEWELE
jgi:toxin ParE1/3/4